MVGWESVDVVTRLKDGRIIRKSIFGWVENLPDRELRVLVEEGGGYLSFPRLVSTARPGVLDPETDVDWAGFREYADSILAMRAKIKRPY